MNPLRIYFKSIDNYISYFGSIPNKNRSLIFNRVPLLNSIHKRWIQSVIWALCLITEPFASLLIVTIRVIPWSVKSLMTKRQEMSEKLFIENGLIMKDRVKSARLYEESKDWLYLIDISADFWDKSKRCHCIFEYITIYEVLKSYIISLITIAVAQTKIRFKYVLRTYNCFDYYLTYYTLRNIPQSTTLYFCNQGDRWVCLFDLAPQKCKIFLQHGIEPPDYRTPYRFKNIDTAYVLSMPEYENLLKADFDNKPNHVYVMDPTIKLTTIESDFDFKVLIVGFPGYLMFDNESSIVESLSDQNCQVILKPHPGKEDMTKYLNLEEKYHNCKILLEKIFPDVDVVISYRSTLAVEYQVYDKLVMFYDEHSNEQIVHKVLTLIKEKQSA